MIGDGAAGFSEPGTVQYNNSTPMEMMLFATGAHAPGAKMPLVFNTAWNRAKSP